MISDPQYLIEVYPTLSTLLSVYISTAYLSEHVLLRYMYAITCDTASNPPAAGLKVPGHLLVIGT